VAVGDDGIPVIAYTRVEEGRIPVGSVVLATGEPGWQHWTADRDPVLSGPPEDDVVQFRDPFLLRHGGDRLMVVGGGRADGTAAAWLYRSPDLRSWQLDGVLAERSGAVRDPVWTGTAWECVQLVEVDGSWVLVVSVWDGDPLYVACALGDFDGSRFTVRRWQRLAATDVPYATTTFRDAAGRPCLVSWLREPGHRGDGWAGMLSVPWTVRVEADRLRLAPHPDVATLRRGVVARLEGSGGTEALPPFLDVELDAPTGGRIELAGADGLLLGVEIRGGEALLQVPGAEPVRLAVDGSAAPAVRLLLDAGLVEVGTSAGDCAALRLRAAGPVRWAVPADAGAGTRVTVHAMPGGDPPGTR
jgi:beta-fructofuranosidase